MNDEQNERQSVVDDTILLTMIVKSMDETHDGIKVLNAIVCNGYDGKESLLVRISSLEKNDDDHLLRIANLENFEIQFKIENRKFQWKFLGVLVISILGWLTALLTNENAQGLDFQSFFQWLFHIL